MGKNDRRQSKAIEGACPKLDESTVRVNFTKHVHRIATTKLDEMTTYDRLGGAIGLRKLVDRFYDLMSELPEAAPIRALHPDDLTNSRDKLFKFLSGFFGGPSLYIQEYGHPMLRARHLPFSIGASEADQWVLCMDQALDELVQDPIMAVHLKSTFRRTADHMVNS